MSKASAITSKAASEQLIRQHLLGLKKLLEQEDAGYQALLRLLQTQARLLTHQDHQGLLAHNPHQLQATAQLAHWAAEREDLLQKLGTANLEALCERLPLALAQTLLAAWQQVKNQARQCRALNDSNGRLLASQKEWLEQRLGVTPSEYQPEAVSGQL